MSLQFNYKQLFAKIAAFTFLFFSNHNYSSEVDISSIKDLLNEAEIVRTSSPKKFNEILEELNGRRFEMSEDETFHLALLNALQFAFKGELTNALKNAEELTRNKNNKSINLRANMLIVNIAAIIQDWEKGLYYLSQSSDLANSIANDDLKLTYFNVAALYYNQLGQYEMGHLSATRALKLSPSGRGLCLARQAYIEAGLALNSITPMEEKVQEAIDNCDDIQEYIWSGLIRAKVAQAKLKNNQHKEVISTLLPFLLQMEKTNYSRLIVEIYSTLANAYSELSIPDKAELYALKATELSDGIQSTQAIIDAHKILYQIQKQKGNLSEALKHHEAYTTLYTAFLDEVSAKSTAFQIVQHQSIQQQNEIRLLNNQNELLNNKNELLKIERSLTQSEAENTRLIATLLSAIVVLLAFFGYRSWHSQRRLKVLAEYDHLTKINNRGHFMALAEETLSLAERAHQTASCIILDLDKFKSINDTYGHAAGDWALKAVVEAVKPCIRDHDIFARLGGEEFVILLPSCDIQAATFVTEKCLKVIEAIDTADSGNQFKITASFGITTTRTSGYQVTSLINDADKALYQSKENGRNQMTIFTNEDD